MRETQLLKGVLDGCVLQIIAKEDIYGYELVQRLKAAGFTNICTYFWLYFLFSFCVAGFINGFTKSKILKYNFRTPSKEFHKIL